MSSNVRDLFTELEEMRTAAPVEVERVKMRPYQAEQADCVEAEWEAGHRSTLVVASTGTGKSVLIGEILNRHYDWGAVA